jgi:hypothetical protein
MAESYFRDGMRVLSRHGGLPCYPSVTCRSDYRQGLDVKTGLTEHFAVVTTTEDYALFYTPHRYWSNQLSLLSSPVTAARVTAASDLN